MSTARKPQSGWPGCCYRRCSAPTILQCEFGPGSNRHAIVAERKWAPDAVETAVVVLGVVAVAARLLVPRRPPSTAYELRAMVARPHREVVLQPPEGVNPCGPPGRVS